MNDETEHLSKTLVFTLSVIINSDAEKRQRIALAYQEAELLVATIPLDNGDARIEACVKRFDRYKAARRRRRQRRMDTESRPGTRRRTKSAGMAKAAKGHRPGHQAFTSGPPYNSLRRCRAILARSASTLPPWGPNLLLTNADFIAV